MSDIPDAGQRQENFFKPFISESTGKRIVSKSLHTIMPTGIWKGRRCFIVGGGTSLKGFDFSQLRGELVIAVNRAMEYVPFAAIMLSQDARLWGWYENGELGAEAKRKFNEFKGYRTWLNTPDFPFPEDIYTIPCTNVRDFEWTNYNYSNGLPFCSSSGLSALCLAVCLGANPIYLLGFDLYGVNGKTANFHAGYPSKNDDVIYKDNMSPNFEQFAPAISKMARVVNLNPKSELKCFEFGELKDIPPKLEMPLLTGFYTKNTGYEQEAKNLEQSLIRFGLEYYLEGVENLKDWRKNVHQKIAFVLRCLEQFKGRNLIQMDSDCVVLQYPELFERIDKEYDIAVHMMPEEKFILKGVEQVLKDLTNVSVLYMKNTVKVKNFIKKWQTRDATLEDHIDDISFMKALKESPNIKALKLPDAYCHIYDRKLDVEPVIDLFQANRRLRQEINEGIEVKKNIMFVSFYTKGTPYEEEVKQLRLSFDKFKLKHDIVAIDNLGSFERNTREKPKIIRELLDKYPESNIVFIDADSTVEGVPKLFERIQEDLGVHYINWDLKQALIKGLQLCTGTMFFQNNARVRKLVDLWINRLDDAKQFDSDQEVLQRLLEEQKDLVTIFHLPNEYVVIPNIVDTTMPPIIKHRQASRKYRRFMPSNTSVLEYSEKKKYEMLWKGDYVPSQCAVPIAQFVINRLGDCKTMVDLGCGDGTTVKILREKGYDCKGLDITRAGIKTEEDGWFLEGSLWAMPFESEQIDFTFSTDVLEHIPTEKIEETIREIFRITKKKTFHCIALFNDMRNINGEMVNLHRTVKPIGWWQEKFRENNAKKLEFEIIDRAALLGMARFGLTEI